jgi:hypothetical protein
MKSSTRGRRLGAVAIAVAVVAPLAAQQSPQIDFKSVGRGAPVMVDAATLPVIGATYGGGFGGPPPGGGAAQGGAPAAGGQAGAGRPGGAAAAGGQAGQAAQAPPRQFIGSAPPGQTPKGIQPLPRDLFTSDDFYKDKDLWADKRYFRCNSTVAIEDSWTARGAIGEKGPGTMGWGLCDSDYPRAAIVSPYPFKTAQEHYEALLAETKKRGGPTQHTYATVPGEWTGHYGRGFGETWYQARRMQIPTMLSLLTPKYQQYLVEETYHQGNTNVAHWQSQYCWPEGFMRRWHAAAVRDHYITVTPQQVQIMTGVARNFITNILIGREFDMSGAVPRLGADVPRWYGETIGFWDKDTLITWTSNVVGWKVHAAFEFSNKMQTIEIYSPNRDASGKFVGLNHEAIFYDPDALVEPIRIVRNFQKVGELSEGAPYVYIECVQTIFPVNGKATPLPPGSRFEYEVLDMFGRPWGHLWEEYNEKNMQRPDEEDIFNFEGNGR